MGLTGELAAGHAALGMALAASGMRSEAIAEYLGYKGAGVAYVTTDVLVPAR